MKVIGNMENDMVEEFIYIHLGIDMKVNGREV
jgi:hypothetical protein